MGGWNNLLKMQFSFPQATNIGLEINTKNVKRLEPNGAYTITKLLVIQIGYIENRIECLQSLQH